MPTCDLCPRPGTAENGRCAVHADDVRAVRASLGVRVDSASARPATAPRVSTRSTRPRVRLL